MLHSAEIAVIEVVAQIDSLRGAVTSSKFGGLFHNFIAFHIKKARKGVGDVYNFLDVLPIKCLCLSKLL